MSTFTIKLADGDMTIATEKLLKVDYFQKMLNFREKEQGYIDFSEGYDPRAMRDYLNLIINPFDERPKERLLAIAEIVNQFCDDPMRIVKLRIYPTVKFSKRAMVKIRDSLEILAALQWRGLEEWLTQFRVEDLEKIASMIPWDEALYPVLMAAKDPRHMYLFLDCSDEQLETWLKAVMTNIDNIQKLLPSSIDYQPLVREKIWTMVWLILIHYPDELQQEIIAKYPTCLNRIFMSNIVDIRKKPDSPIAKWVTECRRRLAQWINNELGVGMNIVE